MIDELIKIIKDILEEDYKNTPDWSECRNKGEAFDCGFKQALEYFLDLLEPRKKKEEQFPTITSPIITQPVKVQPILPYPPNSPIQQPIIENAPTFPSMSSFHKSKRLSK